jgi:hypothetical protein
MIRHRARSGLVSLLALAFVAIAAPAAYAGPVTNTNDSGPGSLRQAIIDASPGDTVAVPAGTYTLTSGQLDVDKTITLAGADARSTVITAGGTSRVIFASGNPATLRQLTITGGSVTALGDCGGGGGICNIDDLVLEDSAVVGNVVNITNAGGVNAVGGGGLYNNGNGVTIRRSSISGNTVTVGNVFRAAGGGGIFDNGDGPATENSTIANNQVTVTSSTGDRHGGGGVYLNSPLGTFTSSTIAGNVVGGAVPTSGGNVWLDGAQALFTNSIVANGSAPTNSNCDGLAATFQTGGGNLESANTCGFGSGTDKPITNPLLGVLANNGGPTDTMALLAGSPAIDAAVAVNCQPTDQRGVARPVGAGCDSGAFEVEGAQPSIPPTPVAPKANCKKKKKHKRHAAAAKKKHNKCKKHKKKKK